MSRHLLQHAACCLALLASACTGGEDGDLLPVHPTITAINELRALMSLPPVSQSAELTAAAQAHVDYLVHNTGQPECGSGSWESDRCSGFSGEDPTSRAAAVGYTGGPVDECTCTCPFFTTEFIRAWQESVFYRRCVSSPDLLDAGYAENRPGEPRANVLDIGLSGSGESQHVARWPPPDARAVPRQFNGWGDPPPPPAGFPSGPVLGVMFARSDSARIALATLRDSSSQVPAMFLGPENELRLAGSRSYFLYSHEPLVPLRQYTVAFTGTRDGSPYDDSWAFRVECAASDVSGDSACDGNDVLACNHGVVTRRECGNQTCIEYPHGAACIDPSTSCIEEDGAFVRCDGALILLCAGGHESVGRDCGPDLCVVGPFGAGCAMEPVSECDSDERVALRCEGDDLIVCEHGFVHRESCGELACTMAPDGGSAYCSASALLCSGPRCAGNVPVQCVGSTERADPICPPGTTCSMSDEQAVCIGE